MPKINAINKNFNERKEQPRHEKQQKKKKRKRKKCYKAKLLFSSAFGMHLKFP